MRVGIGFMLVAGLFACSKEAVKNNTRNNLLVSEMTTPTPAPEPPVFIQELVTETSLGKAKLEIYLGEKGASPVLGQVGTLRAVSHTTTYALSSAGEYSPETEIAPDERSFPAYWIEVKPNEVAMVVFVDESVENDLKNPHRKLRSFETQLPGVQYCSEYRFRGIQYLSTAAQKQLEASWTLGRFEPEPQVRCQYIPATGRTECSPYYNPFRMKVPFSTENYKYIEQEKNAYDCAAFSEWFPPKKQYTETWDLKALVVQLDSKNKSIDLRDERSPLIPGGTQMKTISFSESEVEFKL